MKTIFHSKGWILKFLLLELMLSIPFSRGFFAQQEQWVARYNGPVNYHDKATALALDGSGNVYVTGYSYGSIGYYDYATIKYNSSGDSLWVARYNGPGNDYDIATAMALDESGNVYVTGRSWGAGGDYDFATIKYNANGVEQWVARYDAPVDLSDEKATAIAVDEEGNVYVTGYGYGSGFLSDYLTIKYNSSGDTLWVARYNGPMDFTEEATAIAVDGSGNVYVTGESYGPSTKDYTTIKYNSEGETLWIARYNSAVNWEEEAKAIAVDKLGNVYVTGRSYEYNGTQSDYLTVKYDSSGVVEWVSRYPDIYMSWFEANAIVVDDSSNVYVAGYSPYFSTIKYNSSGDTLWVATYQDSVYYLGVGNAVAIDTSGNVYVTGFSLGSGTFNDYSTIKYNSLGNTEWIAHYNGPANGVDLATAIAVDLSGNVYVTGYSVGTGTSSDYLTIKYVQGPVSVQDAQSVPKLFALYQNYPNPFNPSTIIKYTLGSRQYATLKVYDVLGNEIATLINEEKPAGTFMVKFNAAGLPSGIYFYQLRAGDPSTSLGQSFVETKKMIYLK